MNSSSIQITNVSGIPIKIHWTFGFLILFILYFAVNNQLSLADSFWFFAYVMILFLFVVMHEFGHALTARKYGVNTRDVIISPIGGVARLESIPKEPKHELLIALAGPAVNVGLAALFGVIQLISFEDILPKGNRINLIEAPQEYIGYLLLINLALIVFNLIPAFPMDGGRVLRSLLTMWFGNRLKATRIASIVGQVFAVAFVGIGIFTDYNFMLIFIGIFVYIMARSEYKQIATEHKLSTTLVGDLAYREFTRVYPDDPIEKLFGVEEESSFLVFDHDQRIIGTIPGFFIEDCKKRGAGRDLADRYINKSYGYLSSDMTALTAFQALNNYGWAIAAVIDSSNKLIGVLDRERLKEML